MQSVLKQTRAKKEAKLAPGSAPKAEEPQIGARKSPRALCPALCLPSVMPCWRYALPALCHSVRVKYTYIRSIYVVFALHMFYFCRLCLKNVVFAQELYQHLSRFARICQRPTSCFAALRGHHKPDAIWKGETAKMPFVTGTHPI